jgi:hypothetical protein
MKNYAIFIDDLEIHIALKIGTLESIETIRDEIKWLLQDDPDTEKGYVEQYPFYQADWEITGSNLPTGFDKSTILEITQ